MFKGLFSTAAERMHVIFIIMLTLSIVSGGNAVILCLALITSMCIWMADSLLEMRYTLKKIDITMDLIYKIEMAKLNAYKKD